MLHLSIATEMDQGAKVLLLLIDLGHIKTKQQITYRFEILANNLAYHLFS